MSDLIPGTFTEDRDQLPLAEDVQAKPVDAFANPGALLQYGAQGVAELGRFGERALHELTQPLVETLALAGSEPGDAAQQQERVTAYGEAVAKPLERWDQQWDSVVNDSWITPDPNETGAAIQALGGIARILPPAIIGTATGGPLGGALATAAARAPTAYEDLVASGVDPETARSTAALDALATGAMILAPASVPVRGARFAPLPFLTRAASGVAVNVPLGAAYRGSLAAWLDANGYHEQSQRYAWNDRQMLLSDAVLGAVFGGVFGHRITGEPAFTPTQTQVDAAITLESADHAQQTGVGVPLNHAADAEVMRDLAVADRQANAGEDIDLGPRDTEAAYAPHPDDLEAMALEIEHARKALSERPDGLTTWVRRQGGIRDDRGDAAAIDDRGRGASALLRANGRALDDLALKAWEDGFFPDHAQRPTTAEFLDALHADGRDPGSVTNDQARLWDAVNARAVLDHYEQTGVNTSLRGKPLRDALHPLTNAAAAVDALHATLADAGFSEDEISRFTNQGVKPEVAQTAVDLERNATGAREGPLFSKTNAAGDVVQSTPEALHAAGLRSMGVIWRVLHAAGLAEIVADPAALRARLQAEGRNAAAQRVSDDVAAQHHPWSKKTYFVASNISEAHFKAVVLHEIGVHFGMEEMLGAKGFRELLAHVERLVASKHPLAVAARRMAEERALPGEVPEETMAYMVEHFGDTPLVNRIMAAVRQWLIRTTGSTWGLRLTAADIRDLAVASLRRAARQAERAKARAEINVHLPDRSTGAAVHDYEALEPIKQAIADEPDLKIWSEFGDLPVGDAVDHAQRYVEDAKKMRDGYDAAVQCAIRYGARVGDVAVTTTAGHALGAIAAVPATIALAPALARHADPYGFITHQAEAHQAQARIAMDNARSLADSVLGSNDQRFPVVDPGPEPQAGPTEGAPGRRLWTGPNTDSRAPADDSGGHMDARVGVADAPQNPTPAPSPHDTAQELIDLFRPIVEPNGKGDGKKP